MKMGSLKILIKSQRQSLCKDKGDQGGWGPEGGFLVRGVPAT